MNTADINFKIQDIEQEIGIPAAKWPGKSFFIATEFVDCGVVEGKAVYGIYTGPIEEDGVTFGGRLLGRHGWVETPDGKIVDPTRWVYEDVVPYVHVGDVDDPEYDRAGVRHREQVHRALGIETAPEFNLEDGPLAGLNWPDDTTKEFVLGDLLGGSPGVTPTQAGWLANRTLGGFKDLEEAKKVLSIFSPRYRYLIPIDVRGILGL